MNLRQIFGSRGRRLGILCAAMSSLGFSFLAVPASHSTSDKSHDTPPLIYSENPSDPWNRIFYSLFSRRVEARLSDDFPEAAPFMQLGKGSDRHVSTRIFEQLEIGDRAIDPLYYPYPFSPEGSRQMLVEPVYSEFTGALEEALKVTTQRSAVARALMQSDLWAAHDILFWPLFREDRNTELDRHKQIIEDLLSQMIRKIALTPTEVKALPDNFAIAKGKDLLPDLFKKDSGWMEIQWFADRLHDREAGYRRVTRVFLKPAQAPRDEGKFLNKVRDSEEDPAALLDGVALVTQPLLMDSEGELRPTHLTIEVQIRLFKKTQEGVFQKTDMQVCELSRRLMLREPESGGLAVENEDSLAYLASGGGYAFASPQSGGMPDERGSPVVVRLRTRCATCHGDNLNQVMTFGMVRMPGPLQRVRRLNPAAHEEADYDVSRKTMQPNWKALRAYFASGNAPAH